MSSNLPTNLAPRTLAEAMEFSKLLSESTMIPAPYRGKPSDVLVAVQYGAELGLHPMQAMQNIACINGKPSIYGDAMIGIIRNSNLCEDIQEYLEGQGDQTTAVCVAKRKGSNPVTVKFSVQDAKRAGLWGKSGPWTQYPARMLQMRARGFALRDAFPDVLKGLISTEEARDYPVDKTVPQMKDITPEPEYKPDISVFLRNIEDCESLELLSQQFTVAKMAFRNSAEALKQIVAAKDAAKDRINRAAIQDVEDV